MDGRGRQPHRDWYPDTTLDVVSFFLSRILTQFISAAAAAVVSHRHGSPVVAVIVIEDERGNGMKI